MLDRIDEIELADLRSGRDEYSNLTLAALNALRPQEATEIAAVLSVPAEQAAAIRWVLRGQSVERAVAKVGLDRKKIESIRDKRRKRKELREALGMTDEEIEAMKRGGQK